MTNVFQENGCMTPGLYAMSLLLFQRSFVKRFMESKRRRIIFKGFLKYLKQVRPFGILHSVLVDGSFTSLKIDPDDIDISLVIRGEKADMLDEGAISSLRLLLTDKYQNENKKLYFTHPYQNLLYYPPANEEGHAYSKKTFHDSIDFWGKDREGNPKGLIIIPLVKGAISEIGGLL